MVKPNYYVNEQNASTSHRFAAMGLIPFRSSRDRLCKIEAECYYQIPIAIGMQVDSEVLRSRKLSGRQLRQHADRQAVKKLRFSLLLGKNGTVNSCKI